MDKNNLINCDLDNIYIYISIYIYIYIYIGHCD